jgi:carbohydrate-binding DOMON domain-containing protein
MNAAAGGRQPGYRLLITVDKGMQAAMRVLDVLAQRSVMPETITIEQGPEALTITVTVREFAESEAASIACRLQTLVTTRTVNVTPIP